MIHLLGNPTWLSRWDNTEKLTRRARTPQSIHTYTPVDTVNDEDIHREQCWFEWGVKEAIYVKREKSEKGKTSFVFIVSVLC